MIRRKKNLAFAYRYAIFFFFERKAKSNPTGQPGFFFFLLQFQLSILTRKKDATSNFIIIIFIHIQMEFGWFWFFPFFLIKMNFFFWLLCLLHMSNCIECWTSWKKIRIFFYISYFIETQKCTCATRIRNFGFYSCSVFCTTDDWSK